MYCRESSPQTKKNSSHRRAILWKSVRGFGGNSQELPPNFSEVAFMWKSADGTHVAQDFQVRKGSRTQLQTSCPKVRKPHFLFRAPLPAEWIFRRRFSPHAWILQGLCREFFCGFLCGFFCPSFKGTEGPKKSTEKNHTKIRDKIHALSMKTHHDKCSAEGLSWYFLAEKP